LVASWGAGIACAAGVRTVVGRPLTVGAAEVADRCTKKRVDLLLSLVQLDAMLVIPHCLHSINI